MHPVIEASLSNPEITESFARYPDFLCIGAQKCGTTWLAMNLAKHSRLWVPPMKELQYHNGIWIPGHQSWTNSHRSKNAAQLLFDYMRKIPAVGEVDMGEVRLLAKLSEANPTDQWYEDVFSHAGTNQICGEFTPEYALLPLAALKRIYRRNPSIKILLLLRHPVARAWSHLKMIASVSEGDFDFHKAVRYPDVVNRSLYLDIYDRVSRAFPKENIWISSLEEISENPHEVLASACAHLALDTEPAVLEQAAHPVNAGGSFDPIPEVRDYLASRLLSVDVQKNHRLSMYYDFWRSQV